MVSALSAYSWVNRGGFYEKRDPDSFRLPNPYRSQQIDGADGVKIMTGGDVAPCLQRPRQPRLAIGRARDRPLG